MSGSPHSRVDEFGIERVTDEEPGFVDTYLRGHSKWTDHLLRMQDRYSHMGGGQFSAGITYYSILSIFPILMLIFALAGFLLASRPEAMEDISRTILASFTGDIGGSVNNVLNTAIDQRGTVLGFGAVTALWWGLGWMDNLRYGVSKMWKMDPTKGNWFLNKGRDFLALIALLIALGLGIGLTALGTAAHIHSLLHLLHLDPIGRYSWVIKALSILLSLCTSWCMFFALIRFLPRGFEGRAPNHSIRQAAVLASIAFELVKQFGSLFFAHALRNPAGATFGPIIGIMMLLYLVWRILLYASCWAATTEESMRTVAVPTPAPAVIYVRNSPATRRGRGTYSRLSPKAWTLSGLIIGAIIGAFRNLWK
ncbi:MAG: YhjD/YihY/BrkB family envelope integrity protein [Corynebacterium sp.]|nr:YhjD/YihY/BrkB family envelope integrity protein [Corynebacterium sp.]